MQTKNIIKKLQEIDPTGNTHVRFGDKGEILFFERKEGYYDGAYIYENGEGQLVLSDKGDKIDVYFEDIETRIWSCKGDLDKIKKEIVLDFGNGPDRNRYWTEVVEKEAKACRKAIKTSLEEHTFDVMQKMLIEGYMVTQPADTEIGHYNKMWFEKDKERKKLCQGDCSAILNSGFFEHLFDEGRNCYVWNIIQESKIVK